jgi:hypothetical protein
MENNEDVSLFYSGALRYLSFWGRTVSKIHIFILQTRLTIKKNPVQREQKKTKK